MNVALRRAVPILIVFGSTLVTLPAAAQALQDRFWLQVSGYWPSVDSQTQVSPAAGNTNGTTIDLESDLQLDKHDTLVSVFGGARIGKRFSIGAEYYNIARKGETQLQRDIVFDDVTYNVGGTVTSNFSADIYRLTLAYAFFIGENYKVGAALGLHATEFKLGISGNGMVNGTPVQSEERRKNFLAPLPTIGLFASYEIMPRLTLNARIDYLSLTIDNYHGRVLNTEGSLSYRFLENVGIGVMYRYVDYKLRVNKTEWIGRVAYQFNGPAVFLEVGF